MDTQDQSPAKPADPNAPARHTLPSGKVIELRSHRTLLGEDGAAVIAAQTAPGAQGTVDMHNELIRRMASEIKPAAGSPALDGSLDAVKAQRVDDWRRLYSLVADAYLLILGVSVVPKLEDWEDPTVPTRGSSDSRSPSGGESP